jgi:O-antigen/teichoic acid export membrane protein
LQRFDLLSGIEIAGTAVRASAVVLALSAGFGLVALSLIQLLCSFLAGIAMWWASRRLYPDLKVDLRLSLRPQARVLLSFGAFSSLIHISGMLIYYSDSLVIAAFLPIGLVTFFAIAASLCEYSRQIVAAMSAIVTPRISSLKQEDAEGVEQAVRVAARIGTLITAPIALTFWFRGESFINLWMGPDYGETSGQILRLLAVVVWFYGGRSIIVAALMGLNKHRLVWPGLVFEALCNVAISIALVPWLGLVGVALGTVIPSVIVTLFYLPRRLGGVIGIRLIAFFQDAWVLPTIACIPFGLATFWIQAQFPAAALAVFFMQVTVLLPLVPLAAMLVCLNHNERRELLVKIRRFARLCREMGA